MEVAGPGPRVAFITHNWGANGLSRIERTLFGAALKAGIPFDGLYLDPSVPEIEEGTSRRVSLGGVRAAYAAPAILRYLMESRPSVLIVKAGQVAPAAVMAGRLAGVPVVHWETTFTDRELDSTRFRQRVGYMVEGTFIRRAAAVAVNSTDMRDWVVSERKRPAGKVLFWPTPFDLGLIREMGGAPGRESSGPFRMVAVGRLAEQKGYDVMLEALSLADPHLPAWTLDIIGAEEGWKGGWQERVEGMASGFGFSEKVKLRGLLENPYPRMAEADLFVHAARWEAFGNVLIEALALGTPVLATDCPGGPHEILGEGAFGRLVPNEDPRALAEALISLAGDPDERMRLGEAGMQRSENYSVERLFPRMLTDIERVTGKVIHGEGVVGSSPGLIRAPRSIPDPADNSDSAGGAESARFETALELTFLTDAWGSNPMSRIERALFGACERAGVPFHGVYTDDATPGASEGSSQRFSIGEVRAAWASPKLVKYMREARPKAVIVKSGQLGPATVLAGKLTGTPVIVWEPTINDFEFDSARFRIRAGFRLQHFLYRFATALAGASRDVVEWVTADRKVPPERVLLWSNPFDLTAVRMEGGEEGPPPEPPLRLIAVGRLVEQKGYDVLIEALSIADPDLPEWRLEIVGSEDGWLGNWEARIQTMLGERGLTDKVSLLGHLENPHERIRRSHIFLHPARWEAFGNVIVETMALGTPIIATTCPGAPKEILDGGRYGKLVPHEDPVALAAALVELANDPEERARLGEAGRARSEDYSADRLLPGMLDDLERVTGKQFGGPV